MKKAMYNDLIQLEKYLKIVKEQVEFIDELQESIHNDIKEDKYKKTTSDEKDLMKRISTITEDIENIWRLI